MREDVVAIVPAGGRSRRLQGLVAPGGKAALMVDGESLLARVCRVLATVADVVVVAAPGQLLPELPPGIDLILDREPDRGPLVAIRDGLAHAIAIRRPSPRVALLAACDLPWITEGLARGLIDAVGDSGGRWAVPMIDGHPQVLLSALSVDLWPAFEQAAAGDRPSLRDLLARLAAHDPDAVRMISPAELAAWTGDLRAFADVDTPADLEGLGPRGFSPS